MLDVLRVPGFALLLGGNLVSSLGSWLLVVAVPYHVFQLTGSAGATGLTLAAESLPALLAGPFAGVLVDRWDRRTVMIVTDIVAAVALLGLPLADRPDRLGWLYAALVLESLALVLFRPAARALLPAVVGTGPALATANSLIAVNGGIVRLAGPPLGALLFTWFGLPALVLADLASYLVSALAIALIGRRAATRSGRTVRGVLVGLSHTFGHRPLRGLLLVTWTFWTANAVFAALLIPFMTLRFGDHPGTIGVQLSALGAGYLVGGPVGGRFVRDRPPGLPLALGLAGVGACFAVLATATSVPVAVAATGVAGLPGSLLLVASETAIQRATPDELRGRVGAVFFASDAAAALAGALLGAGLGSTVRVSVVLTTSAGVILALAVVAPRLVRWSDRIILNSPVTSEDGRFAAQRPKPGSARKVPD
jgi:MFS family permease